MPTRLMQYTNGQSITLNKVAIAQKEADKIIAALGYKTKDEGAVPVQQRS